MQGYNGLIDVYQDTFQSELNFYACVHTLKEIVNTCVHYEFSIYSYFKKRSTETGTSGEAIGLQETQNSEVLLIKHTLSNTALYP